MTLTAKLYISVQERQSDPPYLGLVDVRRLHALLKSLKKKANRKHEAPERIHND